MKWKLLFFGQAMQIEKESVAEGEEYIEDSKDHFGQFPKFNIYNFISITRLIEL